MHPLTRSQHQKQQRSDCRTSEPSSESPSILDIRSKMSLSICSMTLCFVLMLFMTFASVSPGDLACPSSNSSSSVMLILLGRTSEGVSIDAVAVAEASISLRLVNVLLMASIRESNGIGCWLIVTIKDMKMYNMDIFKCYQLQIVLGTHTTNGNTIKVFSIFYFKVPSKGPCEKPTLSLTRRVLPSKLFGLHLHIQSRRGPTTFLQTCRFNTNPNPQQVKATQASALRILAERNSWVF